VTYPEALAYLKGLISPDLPSRPYHEVKLARVRHLLDQIGAPHTRLRTVLVAGTKGKGSTASMIAGALRAARWRVGLMVKPHLLDYRERIQVGGHLISRADLAGLVDAVRPAVEAGRSLAWGRPTYVETTVAMALLHFDRSKVDVAVIEVGIGGRLDATNVVDPLVSVITPISYDHMELLGHSLTEIAREKAGIIRRGGIVVSAPQRPDAEGVIGDTCAALSASLVQVGRDVRVEEVASTLEGTTAVVEGRCGRYDLRIPLLGRHQAVNAATAVAAVESLGARGINVGVDAVRRGVAAVRWPARVELVGTRPYILIDVGHNPASMQALRDTIEGLLGGRRLVLVFGMLATKDYRAVTSVIAPLADLVITTTPDNAHALPAGDLAREVGRYTPNVIAIPHRQQAVDRGLALLGPDDVLVVTGSFYLVGEARHWLTRRKPVETARR